MRETVFLNNDREMPLLGLGVYKTADNEAETAINAAVDAGYRLIDTASAYKNEESVGKAIDVYKRQSVRFLRPVRSQQ